MNIISIIVVIIAYFLGFKFGAFLDDRKSKKAFIGVMRAMDERRERIKTGIFD